MPYVRRSRSKKFFTAFAKGMGVVVLVLLTVVATGLLVRSVLSHKVATVSQAPPTIKVAMAEIQEPDSANSEISGKYYGLCKKNSIHSVEDFRKTVQNDPVLSAHFSEFNWESAKLGKQDKDVWTFVSYRKDDVIRRTSKPVRLPKGDGYISDGLRKVRTFCCNDYEIAPPPVQVSLASPEGPVERVDGPPRRMNKSSETVDGPPRQPPSESPSEDSASATPESLGKVPIYSFTTYLPPNYTVHRQYSSGKNQLVVTPEPSSFFLLGTGVVAFSIFCLLRRKRTDKINNLQ
jgi:hypothetical protein